MNEQYIVWLGVAAVLVVGGLAFFRKSKLSSVSAMSTPASIGQDSPIDPFEPRLSLPHAIVLGEDAQRPGVRISLLSDEERYRAAKTIPADLGLGGKLSAGLQAVPALLIAEGHRGKQLMEVVINGDLVRAKDGVGLRAWAVNANNQFSEHARLFDTKNLQTMVNVAAVWQVASVVVAQKHLADISAKLDDIRNGIQEIAHALDEGRRAKITGTHKYLELAAMAVSKGELSPAIRVELESCDRELLQIQHHLQQELERRCLQPVQHNEFAGTFDLEKDTVSKYEELKNVAKDMRLAQRTRALSSHVLSLYPGEPALKQARTEGLLLSAAEIEECLPTIKASAEQDCQKFTSFWNKESTLDTRKANVREAARALAKELREGTSQVKEDVQASHTLLLTHDKPTYVVFEVEDGRVGELRIVDNCR